MRSQIAVSALVFLLVSPAVGRASEGGSIIGSWGGRVDHQKAGWSLFLRLSDSERGLEALADLPEFGYYGLRAHPSLKAGVLSLKLSVYGTRADLELQRSADSLTGTWRGSGVEGVVHLEGREAAMNPPVRRSVGFSNGDVRLAGTLILPADTGPHPAVVWTHGSGRTGREDPDYVSRAVFLARQGVASLIYDKRGVGESTGKLEGDPFFDLADDAGAGAEFLAHHSAIDAEKIGVGGTSQGGWVSPLAASRFERFAYVVVYSAPGITPPEQNVFTFANKLRQRGYQEDEVAKVSVLQELQYDYLRTGKHREELRRGLQRAEREAWYTRDFFLSADGIPDLPIERIGREWMALDPKELWEKVRVPVLGFWGEEDTALPANVSCDVIRKALARGGNPDFTARVFSKASHGLRLPEKPGEPVGMGRVPNGMEETLVNWLRKR